MLAIFELLEGVLYLLDEQIGSEMSAGYWSSLEMTILGPDTPERRAHLRTLVGKLGDSEQFHSIRANMNKRVLVPVLQ